MMKTVFAAAAAVTLAAAAGQALAATDAAPSQTISVAGVNFASHAEARAVYTRLSAAATAACDTNSANPRITQADQRCAQKTLAKAVAQLNRPVLTAMYEQRYGAADSVLASN